MNQAIISDIHGNLEALQAVLADIKKRGIDRILCLGDVVGYGPDPAACLDLVQKRCDLILLGNHEEAVLRGPVGFYSLARDAIKWTKGKIISPWLRPWRTLRYKNILEILPRKKTIDNFLFVHGSPREPTTEYILPKEFELLPNVLIEELFLFDEAVCFGGHTHMPAVFSPDKTLVLGGKENQEFSIGEEKLIINVGSVGQPRDHNPQACYLEFNSERVLYHRVSYPIEKTQDKIIKAGLNPRLAERLSYGM